MNLNLKFFLFFYNSIYKYLEYEKNNKPFPNKGNNEYKWLLNGYNVFKKLPSITIVVEFPFYYNLNEFIFI